MELASCIPYALGHLRTVEARLKISVSMDISVLAFYGYIGYIGDISVDIFYEYRYIEN